MTKNITLSADETLIKKARTKAMKQHTTLNALFRNWLAFYLEDERTKDYEMILEKMKYANPGGKFTREEMNER